MARIRTIKPEIMQDEKLAALEPLPRLVFMGMITQADDAGRLHDNVKLLDGLFFPFTDDTCGDALVELEGIGVILRYRANSGQRLIQITNWEKHQKVKNPSPYVLPAPVSDVDNSPSVGSGESRGRTGVASTDTPESAPAPRDNLAFINDLSDPSVESGESLRRVSVESNAPTPDPRSPNPDPRPSTRANEPGPAVGGPADERDVAVAEMTTVLEAFAEQEFTDQRKRRAFVATAAVIIAGEDRTAWEDGRGEPARWPDRPRLLRLALARVAAGESDKLRGALRWVVPQQLDPDRQRPAIKGEAVEKNGAGPPVALPPDHAAERIKLEQEHPTLYAEIVAEMEGYHWWAPLPEFEKVRQIRQAIREKNATAKVAIVR
jgi:hypothetical protein